jgi:glycosyltransferase involved in cell wall biosynthesis
MKKIRVAINAVTELSARYGSRVYLMGLACELVRTDTIDLILLVGQGQTPSLPEKLQPYAREIEGVAPRSFWQVFSQRRIQEVLAKERIDVYHLPNTLPLLWKSVPTIVTIHDLAELHLRKYGHLRTGYRSVVNYATARIADHVLTVSENSKSDIVKLLRILPEKVTVTHAGIDQRFYIRERGACKRRVRNVYGIDRDFVLAPGGLSKNKNLNNMLLAMVELRANGIQIPLVLTGYGSKKENGEIVRQIRSLGLRDLVVLTGYVGDDELPFLYGACALVLYPSLYEGFGLPALESMASGAPLVASNTSSLPEVVGDAGLLVDPNDPVAIAGAVERLLCDEKIRSAKIKSGLERAELFRWGRVVEKTIQVYRDAAIGSRKRLTATSERVLASEYLVKPVVPIKEDFRDF